jgi:N-sulfoglucosamine sulfohydrolase
MEPCRLLSLALPARPFRRHAMVKKLVCLLVLLPFVARAAEAPATRPSILWLTCEDAGVEWFGCYGNKEAKTPNIDALAAEGFRYTRAFAAAPVCAPSRSGWITGIHAVSMGTQPMRSRYPIPHDKIRYFPDYLRAASYVTANHAKTDYNIGGRDDNACWDSGVAHIWETSPRRPFFQVINFIESHESRAQGGVEHTRHSPADVTLRKYHPDELEIRKNYAKYYDALERMDKDIGKELAALKTAGLADDTIVIFCSDHGGVMPSTKRFVGEGGTHVPLLVRIPEKWQQLWPAAKPGMTVDRLVSLIDMPKTWLALAGAEIPATMQGRVFLGDKADPAPDCVFSYRDRMDTSVDSCRAARDGRFAYIRNEMPFLPAGQYIEYLWQLAATRAWEDAFRHGRTDAVTGRFFLTKPVEELYDSSTDPDNVVNLAGRSEYADRLAAMRARLRAWRLEIHDSGLLPEAELARRAQQAGVTVYDMVRDPKLYHLPAYLDAQDIALAQDPANRAKLTALLADPDSAIRYQAALGLVMLGQPDAMEIAALEKNLADPCAEVRALSAWLLLRPGPREDAQNTLIALLEAHTPATLFVLNVLHWSGLDLAPYTPALETLRTLPAPDPKNSGERLEHEIQLRNNEVELLQYLLGLPSR